MNPHNCLGTLVKLYFIKNLNNVDLQTELELLESEQPWFDISVHL